MSTLFEPTRQQSRYDQNLVLAFLVDKINLNSARLNQILTFYKDLNQALSDQFSELDHLNLKWLAKVNYSLLDNQIGELKSNLEIHKINLLSFDDKTYPQSLKVLENYPLILYYQGNVEFVQNNLMLTVVGSRNVDKYAEIFCTQILGEVCRLGVGVVSGVAIGIDALSHQIALQNNAPTIGVIGSGLDRKAFYPSQNWGLRNKILETNGLILSEYPPLRMPNIYTFPQRNRILAALTDLTWVVQATLKSGSLITALKARDLGKTLATTPADIRNLNFEGNLKILKEGCQIITEPVDITSLMGLKIHPEISAQQVKQFGSKEEERIYKVLTISPQNTDSLSQKTGFSTSEISVQLTMLELSGLACNVGSNEWIRL